MSFLRWGLLTLILFLSGCGYALEGSVKSLPSDIHGLAIPYVKNASSKILLAGMLTDELNRQFTTSKFVRLVDMDRAEAVLDVNIRSVRVIGATLTDIARTSSRRIIITLDASLKRRGSDELLWQGREIVGRETYVVTADQMTTEMNEELAMRKIARDLAERIHNHIFERF
ncbi:MAG: hypothetical protein JRI95_15805 [Deltaproteobacteria bacterium]|nr:hypothetical protein [Deltaproteobacteria bacterium]